MTDSLNILVVDDDSYLCDALCMTLEAAGHRVTGAAEGATALRLVERQDFHLVVSDLRMHPMDGLELLDRIRDREPLLPVLLMTAFADVDTAVSAMRKGACDFLIKPFEPHTLVGHVDRYAVRPLHSEGLVAADPRTQMVLQLAARVARSDATVLLAGESGTGKEVFARFIHAESPRAAGPFVAINCAAIPENLLEATLFGYEKGAFTGAQGAQAGKFEQAQGGTLLLDEISEMPLGLQAKLLRVLQEREVERLGGKKAVALNIRVLATSNRDMVEEVTCGRFREDLFYRLNVFPLTIPPLRERPSDIGPLARHFAAVHGQRNGGAGRLSAQAEAMLRAHAWPGNVRELENVVQRALILADNKPIEPHHLHFGAAQQRPPAAPPGVARAPSVRATTPSMKDLERRHILETLAAVGGSRKRAVEQLGISERTLRYKLQQYRTEGVL
ncbi:MAG: sigma-54-dependent Fis family transcriptional regulator [Betaproteobacteria bacterium]|nr:sigma-54-dependent Fis family transcriptional regulator [Betaproteobacteria bacterium]